MVANITDLMCVSSNHNKSNVNSNFNSNSHFNSNFNSHFNSNSNFNFTFTPRRGFAGVIVGITGDADEDTRDEFLAAGANACLVKPVSRCVAGTGPIYTL